MKKFRNRKSNRLPSWDYDNNGYYFVTICTQNRINYFGEVINGKMILNNYGKIIQKYWLNIPMIYKNINIDKYVIMPNHIHGIIINSRIKITVGREQCSVPTPSSVHQTSSTITKKYGVVSKIIKSFKEVCLKHIRQEFKDYQFGWQGSFHDRIIRNQNEYNKITRYIINNPKNWNNDLSNQ